MLISAPKSVGRRAAEAAFSLIEVVVAVGVIGLVFVTIFGSMTMGLSVTELSRENLRATEIMLDKMEGLRLYSWTQLTNSAFLQSSFTNYYYETSNIGLSNALGSGVTYTGTVTVTNWPFSTVYATNMRQVTVNIHWTSGSGTYGNASRSRSMTTFVALPGLQNYIYND